MTDTIVILGSPLVAPAMALAQAAGANVHVLPPYADPTAIAETVARLAAGAIIVRMGKVTDGVLDASPRLKAVVKHGVGYDTIDVAAASARHIAVVITAGASAQSVAEHALALMFSVARSTAWLDRRMREGHWDKLTYRGFELSGATLGVVGMGSIGRTLIELVRSLRMTVLGYDPYLPAGTAPEGVTMVDDLNDLLAASNIVSLHAPLTDENRNMIAAAQLDLMKPNAILINTGRGGLVDTVALVEALRSGKIAGAGLDTFPTEPPVADNPLFALPNAVVTPHVGASTHEAVDRVGVMAMQAALDLIAGRTIDPRMLVNARAFAAT